MRVGVLRGDVVRQRERAFWVAVLIEVVQPLVEVELLNVREFGVGDHWKPGGLDVEAALAGHGDVGPEAEAGEEVGVEGIPGVCLWVWWRSAD